MLSVGLTGGIGSGKSTVAMRLVERGATLIDSDRMAREVVEPGTEGLTALVAEFGEQILTPDGALDRPALAAVAFADDARRKTLEGILHPRIRRRAAELTAAAPPDGVVVNDVPLLIEAGMAAAYPLVLVVHADAEVRVRRLVEQRGFSESDARVRISAQATDEQRRAAADVWIDNEGTREDTVAAVDRVWEERLVPFAENLRAGRGAPRDLAVVAPDPSWPVQADRIRARIEKAVGERAIRVEHVGPSAAGESAPDVLAFEVTVADDATAAALVGELAAAGLVPGADDRLLVNADPARAVDCRLVVA